MEASDLLAVIKALGLPSVKDEQVEVIEPNRLCFLFSGCVESIIKTKTNF